MKPLWIPVLSLLFVLPALSTFAAPPKPNVLLILIDDLGWQDVGCYDIDEPCPFDTPNIDQLASEGVQFWQAYSPAPTCSPSRGAILAGRHPVRLKRTHVVGGAPPIPHHERAWPLISPWFAGRLPVSETTLPEALKTNGYVSGHVGKWHIAINHHAYPQPLDHGFDFTRSNVGVNTRMKPDRLSDFATTDKDDPYRLDDDGFPRDQNTEDALEFLRTHQDKPFFLYYATWLVHTPIHSRSKPLLKKYCERIGVPFPTDPGGITYKGQKNPYYGAMVEMLDHYVGMLVDHLEGGIRVPLIITGPGIKAGQQTQVMANGLDFYPTILSWTGTTPPAEQALDGADLSTLLRKNPQYPNSVRNPDGSVRKHMMHHFPNSATMHSTLRRGDFKLIRNYKIDEPPFELYRLYKDGRRLDIEEANNLAEKHPGKVKAMDAELNRLLDEMDADYPMRNPYTSQKLDHKATVCKVLEQGQDGRRVWATFEERGNKVVEAELIVTVNGGQKYEEWTKSEAKVDGNKISATLPEGTTHYVFNLIDEHRFLVSHPRMGSMSEYQRGNYSTKAFAVKAE